VASIERGNCAQIILERNAADRSLSVDLNQGGNYPHLIVKGARAANTFVAREEAGIRNVSIYFGSWTNGLAIRRCDRGGPALFGIEIGSVTTSMQLYVPTAPPSPARRSLLG